MARVRSASLAEHGASKLGLSPEVAAKLAEIQAEVDASYREAFVAMTETIQRQASALDRIQKTLELLIRHTQPQLVGEMPAAVRVAGDGEAPDLASAVVVADPIGAGFTLSLRSIAQALGIGEADASILVRAFHLDDDPECAVTVRRGTGRGKGWRVVNYHPSTIDRFRAMIEQSAPSDLAADAKSALKRARSRLSR